MRSAMIMSPDQDGIFAQLLGLVRCGLGGRAGHGRQFISWIHEFDFIHALRFLIDNRDLAVVVNICSPDPLPNSEFMRELRSAWGTRIGVPSSNWMLEVGAFFMRTETELILKSRRVVPARLRQDGSNFSSLNGGMPWMNYARGIVTPALASDTDALQWTFTKCSRVCPLGEPLPNRQER